MSNPNNYSIDCTFKRFLTENLEYCGSEMKSNKTRLKERSSHIIIDNDNNHGNNYIYDDNKCLGDSLNDNWPNQRIKEKTLCFVSMFFSPG